MTACLSGLFDLYLSASLLGCDENQEETRVTQNDGRGAYVVSCCDNTGYGDSRRDSHHFASEGCASGASGGLEWEASRVGMHAVIRWGNVTCGERELKGPVLSQHGMSGSLNLSSLIDRVASKSELFSQLRGSRNESDSIKQVASDEDLMVRWRFAIFMHWKTSVHC